MRQMPPLPIEVFCDFDGTITIGDTTDVILAALADEPWLEIEAEWEAGAITSRECMAKQVALIRGGWKAVQGVLETVNVEPTFRPFAKWCRDQGFPLVVVSDGLDRCIGHLLSRERILVNAIWSNKLAEDDSGNFSLSFSKESLKCGAGVCKCDILAAVSNRKLKVVIGDGRSDFCWSTQADVLFAKGKLLQHAISIGKKHHAFNDFSEIQAVLMNLIAERVGQEAKSSSSAQSLA